MPSDRGGPATTAPSTRDDEFHVAMAFASEFPNQYVDQCGQAIHRHLEHSHAPLRDTRSLAFSSAATAAHALRYQSLIDFTAGRPDDRSTRLASGRVLLYQD